MNQIIEHGTMKELAHFHNGVDPYRVIIEPDVHQPLCRKIRHIALTMLDQESRRRILFSKLLCTTLLILLFLKIWTTIAFAIYGVGHKSNGARNE